MRELVADNRLQRQCTVYGRVWHTIDRPGSLSECDNRFTVSSMTQVHHVYTCIYESWYIMHIQEYIYIRILFRMYTISPRTQVHHEYICIYIYIYMYVYVYICT